MNDLAGDPAHAETKARLKAQLEEYQRETGDPRITGDMDIFKATRELLSSNGKKATTRFKRLTPGSLARFS